MKKREFLKLSSALVAGAAISPSMKHLPEKKIKNWAGNLTYSTTNISEPSTIGELQELVRKYPRFKVLGTRHCFNTIADSTDQFISLKNLTAVTINDSDNTVTIEGGINYGQLCPQLEAKGFALHNLASLPHISVAGACTTATHGSGMKNGNLSTAVSGIEFIRVDGELVSFSREKSADKFNGSVVGLGALGVVSRLTLDLQPSFQVRQWVFEKLPLAAVKDHFEEIMSAGYSVSLFTDWQSETINEVWIKQKMDEPEPGKQFFGANAATKNMHPIAALSADNCTEQLGIPGPWYERLPHFKMGFTPSSGVELQAEYFIPRENAVDAIMAIQKIGNQVGPYLMITEIRAIAEDNFWMSPCHKQPCITIHFTLKQDIQGVDKLLPVIEKALKPFNARPHWGKLFKMNPLDLQSHYPRLEDFINLAKEMDPKGTLRNAFLERNIFGNV